MEQIDSPKFSLMGNLAVFESDETAEVGGSPLTMIIFFLLVHFKVKQRTGTTNLTETIRSGLAAHYGKEQAVVADSLTDQFSVVTLAGVFIMHEGEAKLHVMPDFPGCPWKEPSEVGHLQFNFHCRCLD